MFEREFRARRHRARWRREAIVGQLWKRQHSRQFETIAFIWISCFVSFKLCRSIYLFQCNQIKWVWAARPPTALVYFNFSIADGSMMTLDEAWSSFNDPIHGRSGSKYMQMTTILTQMEHPILFRPFLTLHPCRIAELLHLLPNSENNVLSFLSTIGPAVHLKFDLKYAKNFKMWKRNSFILPDFHRWNELFHFWLCDELNALIVLLSTGLHWRIYYSDVIWQSIYLSFGKVMLVGGNFRIENKNTRKTWKNHFSAKTKNKFLFLFRN